MTPADTEALLGRLPAAVGVNLALSLLAYGAGSVRLSGVGAGLLVGIPIYAFLGWRGFLVLLGMFVIGSVLTRFGYARKARMGAAEEAGGARGASHALANVGVAALAAAGAWIWGHPAWSVLFTAALATSSMDTAGSEIGPLYGRRTVSLKTFRVVAPGTEGAVSLEGTLAGLAAAAALGLLGAASDLVPAAAVAPVVAGALLGNLYEGILGSRRLLSHTWLNATNTLVGGAAGAVLFGLLRGSAF
jgi:uncharacterized protein (TIGR00297 family)